MGAGLPEVRDEAADTPRWVPILGLILLGLGVLGLLYRIATAQQEPLPEEAAEAPAAPAVEAAPAPSAAPPGAVERVPAPAGGDDDVVPSAHVIPPVE
jgi:hypothetical protein